MKLFEVEKLHEELQANKSYFGVTKTRPVESETEPGLWGLKIDYEFEIPPESAGLAATRKGNSEIVWTATDALLVLQSLHARAGTR